MTAESIAARFAELGHDIPIDAISKRIEELTDRFKVPVPEAEASVVSYFIRETGVDRAEYYKGSGANQTIKISDIPTTEGKWINIRCKLIDVWDTAHESMQQVGLVGDETGKIKFTIWKSADVSSMEVDKAYLLENVVTNVWNDRVSISVNKSSKIIEIDDDIEVVSIDAECTGALVAIKPNSGLIKRCPTCKRVLKGGTCSEHGNVDGYYDLRVMGVLDDGKVAQDILLGRELTEEVWGNTMDDAIKRAMDALDPSVVADDISRKLLGRYYTVTGSMADTMLIAKSCEAI